MATAVFFHAHPDDEALATGGTMALLADQGHRVVLVVATNGEEGEPVDGVLAEGEALGDRRATEVAEAAAILGAARVEYLGYRDSGMAGEATNEHPGCFWQADVAEAAARLGELNTSTWRSSTTRTAVMATRTTSRSTVSAPDGPNRPASDASDG